MHPLIKAVVVAIMFMAVPLLVIASWYTCQEGNWLFTYVTSICSLIALMIGYDVLTRK